MQRNFIIIKIPELVKKEIFCAKLYDNILIFFSFYTARNFFEKKWQNVLLWLCMNFLIKKDSILSLLHFLEVICIFQLAELQNLKKQNGLLKLWF